MIRRLSVFLVAVLLAAALSLASESAYPELWQEVSFLNYRGALPGFEGALKEASPEAARLEAMFGVALCLHQRQPDVKGDKERAAELYDELISKTEGNELQPTVLLLRGKLAQLVDYFGDEEDFTAAAGFYRRILKDWPESEAAPEAALYLCQVQIFTMDADRAREGIEELKAWILSHPGNTVEAVQWLLIALGTHMPVDDLGGAAEAGIKALESGLPTEAKLDRLFWQIGNMAERAGRKDIAKTFFEKIILEVPRSSFAYMSQKRLRNMGFDAPELIDPFK